MQKIPSILQALCESPGMQGCVLSDAASGMAIHHCGDIPELEQIGEAAIEFWRVQGRLSGYFKSLGQLHTLAYIFKDHLIALFPCQRQPDIVLICVADKIHIDWNACRLGVHSLQLELKEKSA